MKYIIIGTTSFASERRSLGYSYYAQVKLARESLAFYIISLTTRVRRRLLTFTATVSLTPASSQGARPTYYRSGVFK